MADDEVSRFLARSRAPAPSALERFSRALQAGVSGTLAAIGAKEAPKGGGGGGARARPSFALHIAAVFYDYTQLYQYALVPRLGGLGSSRALGWLQSLLLFRNPFAVLLQASAALEPAVLAFVWSGLAFFVACAALTVHGFATGRFGSVLPLRILRATARLVVVLQITLVERLASVFVCGTAAPGVWSTTSLSCASAAYALLRLLTALLLAAFLLFSLVVSAISFDRGYDSAALDRRALGRVETAMIAVRAALTLLFVAGGAAVPQAVCVGGALAAGGVYAYLYLRILPDMAAWRNKLQGVLSAVFLFTCACSLPLLAAPGDAGLMGTMAVAYYAGVPGVAVAAYALVSARLAAAAAAAEAGREGALALALPTDVELVARVAVARSVGGGAWGEGAAAAAAAEGAAAAASAGSDAGSSGGASASARAMQALDASLARAAEVLQRGSLTLFPDSALMHCLHANFLAGHPRMAQAVDYGPFARELHAACARAVGRREGSSGGSGGSGGGSGGSGGSGGAAVSEEEAAGAFFSEGEAPQGRHPTSLQVQLVLLHAGLLKGGEVDVRFLLAQARGAALLARSAEVAAAGAGAWERHGSGSGGSGGGARRRAIRPHYSAVQVVQIEQLVKEGAAGTARALAAEARLWRAAAAGAGGGGGGWQGSSGGGAAAARRGSAVAPWAPEASASASSGRGAAPLGVLLGALRELAAASAAGAAALRYLRAIAPRASATHLVRGAFLAAVAHDAGGARAAYAEGALALEEEAEEAEAVKEGSGVGGGGGVGGEGAAVAQVSSSGGGGSGSSGGVVMSAAALRACARAQTLQGGGEGSGSSSSASGSGGGGVRLLTVLRSALDEQQLCATTGAAGALAGAQQHTLALLPPPTLPHPPASSSDAVRRSLAASRSAQRARDGGHEPFYAPLRARYTATLALGAALYACSVGVVLWRGAAMGRASGDILLAGDRQWGLEALGRGVARGAALGAGALRAVPGVLSFEGTVEGLAGAGVALAALHGELYASARAAGSEEEGALYSAASVALVAAVGEESGSGVGSGASNDGVYSYRDSFNGGMLAAAAAAQALAPLASLPPRSFALNGTPPQALFVLRNAARGLRAGAATATALAGGRARAAGEAAVGTAWWAAALAVGVPLVVSAALLLAPVLSVRAEVEAALAALAAAREGSGGGGSGGSGAERAVAALLAAQGARLARLHAGAGGEDGAMLALLTAQAGLPRGQAEEALALAKECGAGGAAGGGAAEARRAEAGSEAPLHAKEEAQQQQQQQRACAAAAPTVLLSRAALLARALAPLLLLLAVPAVCLPWAAGQLAWAQEAGSLAGALARARGSAAAPAPAALAALTECLTPALCAWGSSSANSSAPAAACSPSALRDAADAVAASAAAAVADLAAAVEGGALPVGAGGTGAAPRPALTALALGSAELTALLGSNVCSAGGSASASGDAAAAALGLPPLDCVSWGSTGGGGAQQQQPNAGALAGLGASGLVGALAAHGQSAAALLTARALEVAAGQAGRAALGNGSLAAAAPSGAGLGLACPAPLLDFPGDAWLVDAGGAQVVEPALRRAVALALGAQAGALGEVLVVLSATAAVAPLAAVVLYYWLGKALLEELEGEARAAAGLADALRGGRG